MPMFEGFTRQFVPVEGGSLCCVRGGSGPPVLLLHGFPQCLAMWAKVAPALSDDFTVVCADLRGYGDSFKPAGAADHANYSFRAMAADQVAMMRSLGLPRFHVVGHDRGGRTAHRMALDHPEAVLSMTVLDIVPTYAMFMQTNRLVAGAYWHWYFLQQPAPFPERLIGADPDYFYQTCLVGWGASRLADFDAQMLAEYRRCWRDPAMIHGSCADYRAAASIDLEHDAADLHRQVVCPSLALWGESGLMHRLFDLRAQWSARCSNLQAQPCPGGHFLVDQHPETIAQHLRAFLASCGASP
jgi:haloacetate dehalogenase